MVCHLYPNHLPSTTILAFLLALELNLVKLSISHQKRTEFARLRVLTQSVEFCF